MVDRQELDALLVGALYGELTPADEARLAAHLESHPADRTALEDLKSARAAVRESRIFEDQVEPAQALSAMLLQEAHRRAPRAAAEPTEGWLSRFMRMFVTHPAMAAAATLVVVVGVAGAVYMRQGKLDTADPAAERVAMEKVPAAPAAATPPAGAPTPTTTASAAAGSSAGFASGSAAANEANDQTTAKVDLASAPVAEPMKSAAFRREEDQDRGTTRAAKPVAHLATAPAHADTKGGYLALGKKNEPAPKDLDGEVAYESATGQAAAGPGGGGTGGDATARLAPATTVAAPVAPAAAPPPPPPAPAPSPTYAKGGKQKVDMADKPAATPSEAELNKQLKAAINAVNADDCPTSAKIMGDIKQRAPAFYDKHADDREFKHCNAYGDGQVARRKAASKAQAAPADEAPTAAAPVNAVPAPTPTQSQAPAKK